MKAFELHGDESISRGDFYSLMFFVVALGNLAAYAIIGTSCNIVAQVVSSSTAP